MHDHHLPLVFMYRICFKCCLNLEKFHSSQQCYIQYKSSGVEVKQLDQHQEQNVFNSDDVLPSTGFHVEPKITTIEVTSKRQSLYQTRN